MGLFYSNFTLFGPEQRRVIDVVRTAGRVAFVSPTQDGFTTVYDRETERQEFELIERVGSQLSSGLACPVLAAVLHDDDVFYYWLFRDGELADFYNSCPDYFDPEADGTSSPQGGDAETLCAAFGRGSAENINEILRVDLCDEETSIAGEQERHQALAEVIGMPIFPIGLGYDGLQQGYLPAEHYALGFTLTQFVRITPV